MEIGGLLNQPLYGGSGSSTEVVGVFDIAINGRGYFLDTAHEAFKAGFRSIELLRQQADSGDRPSERSLSPEELWRRSQDGWHKGAGQRYFDDEDADPFRFYTSKGIDPWTRGEINLLHATDEKLSSSAGNLLLMPVGSYLYTLDGTALKRTASITVDSPTWTTITGTPGASTSITSDGYNVWTAHGASGVYATTRGAASTSSYNALVCTLLSFVKGRLMAANANVIYNITSGSTPSALFTHANTDFAWVDFAEGNSHIYAAGYSGDKSEIYKIGIKQDGSGLDQGSIAGQLPDGEIVRTIYGYLGKFLLIGTDQGIRLATPDAQGNLTLGALIETGMAVRCFEGQGRFVWFGWSNYDSGSTGLGRLDLSIFTDENVPAYASDLMVSTQGNVLSVVTFQDVRVFTINAVGVYAEDTPLVSSGTLETGKISYGLPDKKTALFTDIRHEPLAGSVAVSLSTNDGTYVTIGESSVIGTTGPAGGPFPTNQARGEWFELKLTLNRSSVSTSTGPTLQRLTLEGYPSPHRSMSVMVPILLHEKVTSDRSTYQYAVLEHREFLEGLVDLGETVNYQELGSSYTAIPSDFQFQRYRKTKNREAWQGTFILNMKLVD